MKKIDWSWFDLKYFNPTTINSYEWEHVFFLYLMPVIPVLLILSWGVFLKFRPKLNIILPKSFREFDITVYLRYIPTLFLILFIELVLVALARPQTTTQTIHKKSDGIDIILAMDVSESMLGLDFEPNRLEAAKKVASHFVKARKYDRMGIVVFSGQSFSLSPLTTDHDVLQETIATIKYGIIHKDGTALGSAIASAINRMRDENSKSKVLILLSDGESNAGQLDPISAAHLANSFGIKIYTIAVGKSGTVNYKLESGETIAVDNQFDESTMKEIARIGLGKHYRAQDLNTLQEIFTQINKLEKSETHVEMKKIITDFYEIYLYWALVCFLIWLGLKSTFMSNIMVD
ncbi:MAG: VWA domain-containing protein [Cytophagales bacterium]